MAEVEKVQKVIAVLKGRMNANSASAVVGYTAKYALWVHENRAMKWKGKPRGGGRDSKGRFKKGRGVYWGPRGRAGFLLDVAREQSAELGRVVFEALRKGRTMAEAVLAAGLRLQRESQRNVPVDTGALRASAFTRVE